MQRVSTLMDRFILEYLRGNEAACEGYPQGYPQDQTSFHERVRQEIERRGGSIWRSGRSRNDNYHK